MRGINRVFLMGRLGQDPELRTLPGGKVVAELRLATHRGERTAEGWQEVTDWHRVRAWEQLAELAGRHLRRGGAVAIEGQLRTERWVDAQARPHTRAYVLAERLHLIPAGSDRDREASVQAPPAAEAG